MALPQRAAVPSLGQSLQSALARRRGCGWLSRPESRRALAANAAIPCDALPVEPARGVPRRDGLAERHSPRSDVFLVGRRLFWRVRGELWLLSVELHACLELCPNACPAVSRRWPKHADLELHHLPARQRRDLASRT